MGVNGSSLQFLKRTFFKWCLMYSDGVLQLEGSAKVVDMGGAG